MGMKGRLEQFRSNKKRRRFECAMGIRLENAQKPLAVPYCFDRTICLSSWSRAATSFSVMALITIS